MSEPRDEWIRTAALGIGEVRSLRGRAAFTEADGASIEGVCCLDGSAMTPCGVRWTPALVDQLRSAIPALPTWQWVRVASLTPLDEPARKIIAFAIQHAGEFLL